VVLAVDCNSAALDSSRRGVAASRRSALGSTDAGPVMLSDLVDAKDSLEQSTLSVIQAAKSAVKGTAPKIGLQYASDVRIVCTLDVRALRYAGG
jgi:hypothetical protein